MIIVKNDQVHVKMMVLLVLQMDVKTALIRA